MKKIVAFMPIKMNNERLPGKNTKCFDDGTPLIELSLKTLSQVKEIDEAYVYCSNEDITKYLTKNIKYLKRSESLDTNTTKINEVIDAFVSAVDADIYMLIHATAPFIKPSSIKIAIDKVCSNEYDSAFTVKKLQEFMWKDDMPINYTLENIPRTQDLPPIYMETSGFYIFEKNVFLSTKRRIGKKPYLLPISEIEAIDINNPTDFLIANAIYMKGLHTH